MNVYIIIESRYNEFGGGFNENIIDVYESKKECENRIEQLEKDEMCENTYFSIIKRKLIKSS